MPPTTQKKPGKPKNAFFLRNIPRDLRQKFKAACAMRDITMSKRVQEWMKKDIHDERNGIPFTRLAK